MTEEDRLRWDTRYSAQAGSGDEEPGLPEVFAPYEDLFPTSGSALDLACGRGAASVWLAARGMEVCGVDVSTVALDHARRLAARHGVIDRCRFRPADLDGGMPAGPPADVIVCHLYRDRRLYAPMAERLKDGGLLAVAVLSEVGDRPGPFRAAGGELAAAFRELSVVAAGEAEGRAWLLARR